jgi:thiol-disulfide isomerase/thioredoxin
MFDKIRKNPVLQIVLLALVIIIIISVFTPRGGRFSAGVSAKGHVGSLRGGFGLETFENDNKGTLVLFHADWCGHCKRLMPEFQNFESNYQGPVNIVKYNESQDKELIQQHNVQGYPTIRYYPNGLDDVQNYSDYEGPRTTDGLNNFVSGVLNKMPDNAASV